MAFTLPDDGEGVNTIQSILFQEYLDVLAAGLAGIDCVLSGGAITGGIDMTPAVAKCAVLSNKVLFAVAAADVTISAADVTNPRIDLIVVTSAGALAVRAGTAAAAPKPPARTANDVVLGAVYVAANDTAIATTEITDMRVTPSMPQIIYRTTTAEVTNNTAAVIQVLNKTASGVTIPDGLFLAGRLLRVRIWGNVLINSGTPTLTLAVLYGATTMFADTSAASAADADRRAFFMELMLVAQANNDQALTGKLSIGDFSTAVTAPTTGIGDAFPVAGSQEPSPTFGGSAAIDSDIANSVLSVRWTFSVANAANEMVVEGATVELI